MDPLPSLSSFMKRFLSRWISAAETVRVLNGLANKEMERAREDAQLELFSISWSSAEPD